MKQYFSKGEEKLIDDFDDENDGGLQQKQLTEVRLQNARNKEIEEIVSKTNDLAALFKEFSVLVIEQGTVLDRIDYNVEDVLVHTKKGKKHIVKAKEYSESSRARNIII